MWHQRRAQVEHQEDSKSEKRQVKIGEIQIVTEGTKQKVAIRVDTKPEKQKVHERRQDQRRIGEAISTDKKKAHVSFGEDAVKNLEKRKKTIQELVMIQKQVSRNNEQKEET